MSSDVIFDLRRFWDLVCAAGLERKKIGELTREEVEKLLEAAYRTTTLDRVPF